MSMPAPCFCYVLDGVAVLCPIHEPQPDPQREAENAYAETLPEEPE